MTDLVDVTENEPIACLVLLAYNQEKYVRDAIEGAFSQRFSPLEIILSDDCSTDGTFTIMEEMAAAYRGPHLVHARREPSNVGTVKHLMNVAHAARGELLVVAAGDDISYPDRVGSLLDAWKETDAAALASWHDEIDANGRMLRENVNFPPSKVTQWLFGAEAQAHRVYGMIETVPGFCAAYPRSFWTDLPYPPCRLVVEDGLAGGMIILRGGRIQRVPRSLIAYRLLDNSASDRTAGMNLEEIQFREAKIDRHARDSMASIDYIIDQARREGIIAHPATLRKLTEGRSQNELIAGYWETGPVGRFLKLGRIRSLVDAKFIVPRLLGMWIFTALRIRLEKLRNLRAVR